MDQMLVQAISKIAYIFLYFQMRYFNSIKRNETNMANIYDDDKCKCS